MGYCSGRYNVQEAVSEVLGRAIHEEVQTIIHETDQNRLTEIEPLVRDCCALDRGRERSEVICPNTSSRISNWHHPGRRTSGPVARLDARSNCVACLTIPRGICRRAGSCRPCPVDAP